MKQLLCGLAFLATTAVAADEKRDKPKSDEESIQGTWEVFSSTEAGKDVSETARGLRFIFGAETLMMQPKDAKEPTEGIGMKYVLHPTKKPQAIDTSHELDPGKPIVQLGIYLLEGDSLKLCLEAAGKPRPTRIESKPESTSHVFELRRVKKDK
jgi:uncharacterized protein (TIGR03067 family)